MKLGKHAPRHDKRTLRLAKYLAPDLPPPPASVAWSMGVGPWGMMKNDALGDCTCAAAGHLVQSWTANSGSMVVIPDADIVAAYSTIAGYDPAEPLTDRGANMLDVLTYWRSTGIGGHQIGAFAAVDQTRIDHVKNTIALFGGAYIGLGLPLSAQGKASWELESGLGADASIGSWGGHAVPVLDYDDRWLTVITWGAPLRMSWDFFATYCDEAYAPLSPEWIRNGVDPCGVDLATLRADLAILDPSAA